MKGIEMIHYYIAWNRIKDNRSHGREFMRIAKELGEKHGFDITKTKDASSFELTEKAPKLVKQKHSHFFKFFHFLRVENHPFLHYILM